MEAHRKAVGFKVQPAAIGNVVVILLGTLLFMVVGVWMIVSGEGTSKLLGVLCLVVFGGSALFGVPRLLSRPVSMVLWPDRMEQITVFGAATILWRDVEQIGVVRQSGVKLVGIRLMHYDNYLKMSPELAAGMVRFLPYLKWAAWTTSLWGTSFPVKLWSRLEGHSDPETALKAFGSVGDLAGALAWSRQHYGYDILIPWTDLDRPAKEFASLLEQHRRSA